MLTNTGSFLRRSRRLYLITPNISTITGIIVILPISHIPLILCLNFWHFYLSTSCMPPSCYHMEPLLYNISALLMLYNKVRSVTANCYICWNQTIAPQQTSSFSQSLVDHVSSNCCFYHDVTYLDITLKCLITGCILIFMNKLCLVEFNYPLGCEEQILFYYFHILHLSLMLWLSIFFLFHFILSVQFWWAIIIFFFCFMQTFNKYFHWFVSVNIYFF